MHQMQLLHHLADIHGHEIAARPAWHKGHGELLSPDSWGIGKKQEGVRIKRDVDTISPPWVYFDDGNLYSNFRNRFRIPTHHNA